MTRILAFIAAHMGFLWADARFRITGSVVGTSNGGDALLTVESDRLRLQFTCDRAQLLLDFQPAWTSSPGEWFSIDLIRRLLLGTRESSALLDESYAEFLHQHLDEIEDLFTEEKWADTRSRLKQLKVKRSKELFG